jgi:hypothetical protein
MLLHEAFFKPHFDDVVHGRAGLHERLAPVLAKIAPRISSARLVKYWRPGQAITALRTFWPRPAFKEHWVHRIRRIGHFADVPEHRARYATDCQCGQ